MCVCVCVHVSLCVNVSVTPKILVTEGLTDALSSLTQGAWSVKLHKVHDKCRECVMQERELLEIFAIYSIMPCRHIKTTMFN